MNLEAVSNQHRNVVLSAGALLGFAIIMGIGSKEVQPPIVVAVVWVLSIFHGISVFRLVKCMEPNRIAWALFASLSVAFFFIPTCAVILSANKIFKQHGWIVKFYGGAQSPYNS